MLIPFAMEDGGRIGAHGLAALRMLAEYVVTMGKSPPTSVCARVLLPPEAVAMWMRRWQHKLSIWLHLIMARHVIRYLAPSVAAGAGYS